MNFGQVHKVSSLRLVGYLPSVRDVSGLRKKRNFPQVWKKEKVNTEEQQELTRSL